MKRRFMRRSFQWTIILGVLLALTLGVAACGGSSDTGVGAERRQQKEVRIEPPDQRKGRLFANRGQQ
jgi:hypothetical protein